MTAIALGSAAAAPPGGERAGPTSPDGNPLAGPPELRVPPAAPDAVVPDSSALHREARAAQARFERRRIARLPWTWAGGGGSCDERIGRMCLRFGSGSDWERPEEDEAIREARDELLAALEDIAREIPGDDWVLGQRVHYLGEEERWGEAEALARECGGATPWWCRALLGYALHHGERFPEAAAAFDEALDAMSPERADEWRDLERLLDRDGARLYRSLDEPARRALEERIWALANPLLLIPGNDRLTEHLARHTTSLIRERARNPHNISWGSDLAELTIRYGAPYGWERDRDRWRDTGPPRVVGRFHPKSRGLLPPGEVLEDPLSVSPDDWPTDEYRARARHAPAYSPRIHPLTHQVSSFRRGDSVLVVARWRTTITRDHERADWEAPPEGPYRSGIFLIPVPDTGSPDGGGAGSSAASSGPAPERSSAEIREGRGLPSRVAETGREGTLVLTAPAGRYVLSVETWHPAERRAWRARHGLHAEPLPRGVVGLSDLLLTEALGEEEPLRAREGDLERLAAGALAEPHVPEGGTVGLVWEVYGLEPGDGTLRFRITVEAADRDILRRAGEWLGIVEPEPPVVLSWSEPGPEGGGTVTRAVDVELGSLPAGDYELRLELDLPGRTSVVTTRPLRVVENGASQ